MIKSFDLIPRWQSAPVDCKTHVECSFNCSDFVFKFFVDEAADCFRLEHHQDGDECWQDSCVEVFLQSGWDNTQYFNFECNAAGAVLGELGSSRANRTRFSAQQYAQITRQAHIISLNERVTWTFELRVPSHFININHPLALTGNLYKCASKAKCPHYLSAFDIPSSVPDFHRPEGFKKIFL